MKSNVVKFIDLFAGLVGIRLGFEQAFKNVGIDTECVMSSEIKPYAIETLKLNFEHNFLAGDIFNIHNDFIPNFDFLLGGCICYLNASMVIKLKFPISTAFRTVSKTIR